MAQDLSWLTAAATDLKDVSVSDNVICGIGSILTYMFPNLVLDISLSTCDPAEVKEIISVTRWIDGSTPEYGIINPQIDTLLFFFKAMYYQTLIDSHYDFSSEKFDSKKTDQHTVTLACDNFAEECYYQARVLLMFNHCYRAKDEYQEYLDRGGTRELVGLEEKCKGL
jgi:hypothetical protein